MELPEIIDDLLRHSTEAHTRHADAVKAENHPEAERALLRYVTLLHAAKMVDSAIKVDRYVQT